MQLNRGECWVENHGLRVEWCFHRADPNLPEPKMAICHYSLWYRVPGQPWVMGRHPFRSQLRLIDAVAQAENKAEILALLFPVTNATS